MSEPASSETEVTFLRSQLASLSDRLCQTLTQQVAQQQTVLIASMQANLAMTQTIDRLNKMIDCLTENLERMQEDAEEETTAPGSDFGALLTSLAPYLLGGSKAPAANQNPNPAAPVTIQIPSEVAALMRHRTEPQASTKTATAPAVAKAQAKKKPNPKEDAT